MNTGKSTKAIKPYIAIPFVTYIESIYESIVKPSVGYWRALVQKKRSTDKGFHSYASSARNTTAALHA